MLVKKYNLGLLFILSLLISILFSSNGEKNDKVNLEILVKINRNIYEMSDFGEPPQIAVWLENPDNGQMRTVWVTRRSGRRLWKGKFECPTALPLWESRHANEKSDYKKRGLLKRLLDAITGATPTGGIFKVKIAIKRGTVWECYVEMNLSGDFNRQFPYRNSNGMPDPQINGQPSLIYKGVVKALPGEKIPLKLIGRTDQWVAIDYIIKDLTGITSAKKAVTDLQVICKFK